MVILHCHPVPADLYDKILQIARSANEKADKALFDVEELTKRLEEGYYSTEGIFGYRSWEQNKQYIVNDKIVYNKCVYNCIENHISGEELEADKWEVYIGGGSGSDTYFYTTSPINNAIGQFKNNQEINESDRITVVKALNMILHKDENTTVSLSVTNQGLNEKGTIVVTPTLKATINKGTATPISITFYKNSTQINKQEYESGKNIYTYTLDTDVTNNTTFKVDVTYSFNGENIKTASSNASITFANKSYYGIVDNLVNDEEIIKALNSTLIGSKGLTYNNITMTNKRICYAYDKSFGKLTSILDGNGFQVISSYTQSEITINLDTYYVYTTTGTSSLNNGKMIFS